MGETHTFSAETTAFEAELDHFSDPGTQPPSSLGTDHLKCHMQCISAPAELLKHLHDLELPETPYIDLSDMSDKEGTEEIDQFLRKNKRLPTVACDSLVTDCLTEHMVGENDVADHDLADSGDDDRTEHTRIASEHATVSTLNSSKVSLELKLCDTNG